MDDLSNLRNQQTVVLFTQVIVIHRFNNMAHITLGIC